jgi:hypothetical protein
MGILGRRFLARTGKVQLQLLAMLGSDQSAVGQ